MMLMDYLCIADLIIPLCARQRYIKISINIKEG